MGLTAVLFCSVVLGNTVVDCFKKMYLRFAREIFKYSARKHLLCFCIQCYFCCVSAKMSISIFMLCRVAARQWNHIEDLDDFFTRVYQYHQRSGFLCMVLQDVLQLMYASHCLFIFRFVVPLF